MRRSLAPIAVLISVLLILSTACSVSGDDDPTATAPLSAPTATASSGSGSTPDSEPTSTSKSTSVADTTSTSTSTEPPTSEETETATSTSEAAPEGTTTVSIEGQSLTIPAGYTISVFAEDLGAARFMALDDEGDVYVTDRLGRVLRLPDENGDGVADEVMTILDGLDTPHGITFYEGELYVAEETRVIRASDADGDGSYETIDVIVDGLPSGGHSTRTIRFGPDGMLYVSIGSSCNVCEEEDDLRAAIWRYNADGTDGEPFAIGLRNAVGITFDDAGLLWVTNNGRDGLGDDVPPETINQPNLGDNFGWPLCHSGNIIDPLFGAEGDCDGITQPSVLMQAHSAPLGLTFVSGEQFASFEGDMLVAFHGSWNRTDPTGYMVVRLPFVDGVPTGEVLEFVAGWLLPGGDAWARPVDVLFAADGSLLISDDEAGYIFRLARDE